MTFNLTTPLGDFANVLAFPATAPVPQTTPMTVLTTDMPAGVGPYMFQNVVPNASYEIVKNPLFASFHIPGIPLGNIDTIKTVVVSNNLTEAEDVLANRVDAFDVGDAVPATLLGQIQSQANDRFAKQTVASTNYFFFNQRIAPFNNILARQAAAYAIDRSALARLAGGFVAPSCYFIPVGIVGHPTGKCPYPSPNIAKARALLKKAHLLGAQVSVYGMAKSPRQEEAQYYASALKQAGFNPQLKLINPAIYWTTIGNAKTRAQTGMGGQFLDFPAPDDFLLLIDARNIHPVKSNNFGNVNDPVDPEASLSSSRPCQRRSWLRSGQAVGCCRPVPGEEGVHDRLGLVAAREVLLEPHRLPERCLPPALLQRLLDLEAHEVEPAVRQPGGAPRPGRSAGRGAPLQAGRRPLSARASAATAKHPRSRRRRASSSASSRPVCARPCTRATSPTRDRQRTT